MNNKNKEFLKVIGILLFYYSLFVGGIISLSKLTNYLIESLILKF